MSIFTVSKTILLGTQKLQSIFSQIENLSTACRFCCRTLNCWNYEGHACTRRFVWSEWSVARSTVRWRRCGCEPPWCVGAMQSLWGVQVRVTSSCLTASSRSPPWRTRSVERARCRPRRYLQMINLHHLSFNNHMRDKYLAMTNCCQFRFLWQSHVDFLK